jgi:hypothetical protein
MADPHVAFEMRKRRANAIPAMTHMTRLAMVTAQRYVKTLRFPIRQKSAKLGRCRH